MMNIFNYIYDNFGTILVVGFIIICIIEWLDMLFNSKNKFKIITNHNHNHNNVYISEMIEKIKKMEGREFEEFCFWMFKSLNTYKSVKLTPATNDEGKDIILKDNEDNYIYVECKRYTEKASINEEFMIGRPICQKLVGAMISDNIEKAIIVTTGNVHQNAWEYIIKLEKNTNIKIDIFTIEDIKQILKSIDDKGLDFVWS